MHTVVSLLSSQLSTRTPPLNLTVVSVTFDIHSPYPGFIVILTNSNIVVFSKLVSLPELRTATCHKSSKTTEVIASSINTT